MDQEIKRRSFFRYLFSSSAFIGGSNLSFKKNSGLMIGKISQTTGLVTGSYGNKMKKIAVEEHASKQDLENLDKRLRDMDEGHIDMQVFASVPVSMAGVSPADDVSTAKDINDTLAKITEKYPERFACYTTLPMSDPDAAANELERAVKQLGLKGPLVYAGHDGSYVDEKKFWGIYETAQRLDVPVYVHPGTILPDMSKPYMTYPILSYAMWGFAAATGLHAMRLIVSGVFDRYSRLKIMLGHLGEGIPYWLWRMDKHYKLDQAMIEKDAPGNNLKKLPSQYLKENFYVTTSGMLWEPALQFVISVLGADRILFACDYPPEPDLAFATQWIDSVSMSAGDREKICHLNAEKLFKL